MIKLTGRAEALKAGENKGGTVGIKSKFSRLLKTNFKSRGALRPTRPAVGTPLTTNLQMHTCITQKISVQAVLPTYFTLLI